MQNSNIDENKIKRMIIEETIRYKKQIMLEVEKTNILNRLQEINECDIQENEIEEGLFGLGKKTDWGQEADAKLMLPAYHDAAVKTVAKYWQAGPEKLGKWAQNAMNGLNLQDTNQRKTAYNNVIKAYKELWKQDFIKNQGNMLNTTFDPATGVFTKHTQTSGNWNMAESK